MILITMLRFVHGVLTEARELQRRIPPRYRD
jgi:hypothetical protein